MIAYRINQQPGDLFDGKYRIIERIGTGNYGDVFKVKDASGYIHALKLLRLWEVSNELHENLINKFKQEYTASRISSEYLVHSLDFGIIQGNPYILMEYCSKGDLSRIIGKDISKLPSYAHDILRGLHVLHTEGKIHRDLKPENVLIRDNGRAALTDFGVVGEMDKSKRMSEVGWWHKRPRQPQGTPIYMAPEMAERVGGGVTYLPTIDIWSFGVMMFELLTAGSFPFGNIEKIEDYPRYQERAKKNSIDFFKLDSVPHGIQWKPIIGRCLSPNYRERYQSAFEVLKDMQSILGDIGIGNHDYTLSRSTSLHRLTITQGENMGTSYDLKALFENHARMIRIGREISNDIVLQDQDNMYISRYHFTLEKSKEGNYWLIKDGQWRVNERRWMSSTNGTFLNSKPVTKEGLKVFTGDIITVGTYKIKVE